MRNTSPRRLTTLAAAVLLLGAAAACEQKSSTDDRTTTSGEPIVVGSTLSLSGAFAATGSIHKIAGEAFVARLNANGGLLGRQVRWIVRDDESDQAKVSSLYEQLITQDRVDLIIGPYATPNILSAMAVAERHGYTMPQHTAVLAPLMTYRCQFPGWSIGPTPNEFVPNQLFDAVATCPDAAETGRHPHQPERLDRLRLVRLGQQQDRHGVHREAARPGRRAGGAVPAGHDELGADGHPGPRRAAGPRDQRWAGRRRGQPAPGDGAARLPPADDVHPVPGARPAARARRRRGRDAVGHHLRAEQGHAGQARPGGDRDRQRLQGPCHRGQAAVPRRSRPRRRPPGTPGRSWPPGSRAPAASTSRRCATPCTPRAPTRRSAAT